MANNNGFSVPNNVNTDPQSWYDLQVASAIDIRNMILNAYLGSTQGVFTRSSNYATPGGGGWITSPFVISANPTCATVHTDDMQMVADAAQWNMTHGTWNSSTSLCIPLRKLIFLRAGNQWEMTIPISFGGATYTDLQLSFRDNAATAGDFTSGGTGTMPVLKFTGSFTGAVNLKLTINGTGHTFLGMRAQDNTGATSMFEMEIVVVL